MMKFLRFHDRTKRPGYSKSISSTNVFFLRLSPKRCNKLPTDDQASAEDFAGFEEISWLSLDIPCYFPHPRKLCNRNHQWMFPISAKFFKSVHPFSFNLVESIFLSRDCQFRSLSWAFLASGSTEPIALLNGLEMILVTSKNADSWAARFSAWILPDSDSSASGSWPKAEQCLY